MTLFFAISGFVICSVEERKQKSFTYASGARHIARRLVRLCPIYWIALWLMFYLAASGDVPQEPFVAWPIQAAFLQALFPLEICGKKVQFSHLSPGWFTSALIISAFCFPVLFNVLPRGGWKKTLAVLVVVCAMRSLPTFLHEYLPSSPDLYAFAPLRLLEVVAGMLAARLCKQLPPECSCWWAWGLVMDMSVLMVLSIVYLFPIAPTDPEAWAPGLPVGGDYVTLGFF